MTWTDIGEGAAVNQVGILALRALAGGTLLVALAVVSEIAPTNDNRRR